MGKEDVEEERSQQREQQCEFLVRPECVRGHCGCWLRRAPGRGPGRPGKGLGFYLKCKQKLREGFEQGCGVASFILYRARLPARRVSLRSRW